MESSPSNPRLPYWPWIAAAWMGIGLIDACETVFPMRAQGMHHAWVSLFTTRLLVWLPWALATPLVIQLGRRHPVGRTSGLRSLALHLGAAVTIGMVSAAWDAALAMLLNPWLENPPPTHFVGLLFARLFSWELVENAIKHGISKRAHGGHVQVAAERAGDLLNLRVGNDGPSLPADFQIGHTGIGIVNLRDRLRLLYGTGFELSLRNRDAGGVQVSISLPLVGT